MNALDIERTVGIETFFFETKGIGGKLRTIPEDFVVKEIFQYPKSGEKGVFTIAEITSKNWETNLLIRELSNRLHISRNRIGFAGTKDKRSCSTQLMSFYNVPKERLTELKIKDVSIENVYCSVSRIKIGALLGNSFDITVRDIDSSVKSEEIQNIISQLIEKRGFPNFYGIQRFGIMRPITHIVGKHIVHGNFEEAVMTYIANPIAGEDKETYELRKKLQQTKDFAEALKSYPDTLNFEKAILNRLIVDPEDFVNALKELPKNLLTMFIYAYQSYLFNLILSKRILKKIPLNEAVIGDVIYPIQKGFVSKECILVTKSNIEKVNKQILNDKAVVTAPLFGSDPQFSEGEMGEIERDVIENEKINPQDFIVPEIPYISSYGSRRPILAPLKDIVWKLEDDKLHVGKLALNLKFDLQKGTYATSLLREFMRSNDIRNY